MLIHPTVERLRTLGLTAMADAFIEMHNTPEAAELTREDWLGLLVDREATSRENKRLARRLRDARLRQAAVVEDSICMRLAASTEPCSTSSPPASGCAIITISSLSVRPVSASRGWLAPSATRRVATVSRCSISAPAACSAT